MCEAESTVFYMLHNMYYRLGTLVAILRRYVSSKVESIVHPSCVCTYGSYDHCFVHAAYVSLFCTCCICMYVHTMAILSVYVLFANVVFPHILCNTYRSTSTTKSIKERRAFSTESIQLTKQKYSPVLALRNVVRAEREAMTQSVEVSILSEKAAAILGIAPPKHYKRASTYDPLMERRSGDTDTPTAHSMPPRSNSYHPGLRRGRAFDRGVVS